MRGSIRALGVPIAVALSLTLLGGCASPSSPTPEPSASEPARPSPSSGTLPTPAASQVPVTPVALVGWRPVADGLPADFQPDAVIWTGERFVAAGQVDGTSVIVVSGDGTAWARSEPLADGARVRSLAAGAGGVVAVGAVGDRPTAWYSPNGDAWQSRALTVMPRSRAPGSVLVTDVVAAESGWLAVGREDPPCQTGCGVDPGRAVAWASPDGRAWGEVPEQASLSPGGMNAVIRWPAGFLAVGVASRSPAIWTSSDGSSWSRIGEIQAVDPTDDPTAWATVVAIGASDGVAVCLADSIGYGPGGAPVVFVWATSDGRSWHRAMLDGATPVTALAVTPTAKGWLVTGRAWNAALDRWVIAAWASADGLAWTSVASGPGDVAFAPASIAASPTVEVAVGIAEGGGSSPASALWWRPAP